MSDKTCTTCRWFKPEMRDPNAGHCFRYPNAVHQFNGDEYWCGEWSESEVTDEHTFLAGGVPAYKVTERENGTSTTEPVSDEDCERYIDEMMHEVANTTFEFDGELTIVGIERKLPVRILNCPTKPGVIEIHDGGMVRRYVEETTEADE